jgi:hypothetical protein
MRPRGVIRRPVSKMAETPEEEGTTTEGAGRARIVSPCSQCRGNSCAETLAWLAAVIHQTRALIVYTDEEVITREQRDRKHLLPAFRAAFDYDLLLQQNYFGQAFCIQRQVFASLGGLPKCGPLPYYATQS